MPRLHAPTTAALLLAGLLLALAPTSSKAQAGSCYSECETKGLPARGAWGVGLGGGRAGRGASLPLKGQGARGTGHGAQGTGGAGREARGAIGGRPARTTRHLSSPPCHPPTGTKSEHDPDPEHDQGDGEIHNHSPGEMVKWSTETAGDNNEYCVTFKFTTENVSLEGGGIMSTAHSSE